MKINYILEAVNLIQQMSIELDVDTFYNQVNAGENYKEDREKILKFIMKNKNDAIKVLNKYEDTYDLFKSFAKQSNLYFYNIIGSLISLDEDGLVTKIESIKKTFVILSFIKEGEVDTVPKSLEEIILACDEKFINPEVKMTYLKFYLDFNNKYLEMKKMVNEISLVIKKNIKMVSDVIDKYNDTFTEDRIVEIIKSFIGDVKLDTRNTCISIINYNTLSYINNSTEMGILEVGIFMDLALTEQSKVVDDTWRLTQLKAISDATRMKIVRSSMKGPIYQQGMAKELNVSAASLSHHFDILLNSGLIKVVEFDKDNKKVYYSFNEAASEKLMEELKNFFNNK